MSDALPPAADFGGLPSDFNWLVELLATETSDSLDDHLQWVELAAGEKLFEQGDPGDSMYVLRTGALGVCVRHNDGSETLIDQLGPGALVGEMALISGQPRSATVYAVVDSGLIRLTEASVDRLTALRPEAADTLEATVTPRVQRLQLAAAMKGLVGELDPATVHELQEAVTWQRLSNGDLLYQQDDPANGMYLVINGRLRQTIVTAGGDERELGEAGPGQLLGEFSMLTNRPRVATARAVRASTVAGITLPLFRKLTADYPEMMGRLTQRIIDRQVQGLTTTRPIAPVSLSLAVIPAGPEVDSEAFARALVLALNAHGPALALTSRRCDLDFGKEGAAYSPANRSLDLMMANWVDEIQSDHRYIVYAADPEPNEWTKRCINYADRVLTVSSPDSDPARVAAEAYLDALETPLRTELVLWWPAGTEQPSGTAAWLDGRDLHAHHHVRQDDASHMERLARRLSGHATGLVLSGGAARGFAHLGVLQAVEELGIPVDYIGGTSMGAVVAAAYNTMPYEQMLQELDRFKDPKVVFDRTLPFTSLMASDKVTRLIRQYFEGVAIEDMWRPFFCVATNLTTAEEVVYTRGPLWRAVRASMAIPGVFTPVMDNGDVLTDGGVLHNFPVELMAGLCESDRIIGVNVAPFQEKKRDYDFDTSISGWRILWSRINPFRKPVRSPALVGTIMRALEINSVQRSKSDEQLVDLMIYPDTSRFGLYDFSQYEPIAAAGYEAAYEPLRAWRADRLS